VKLIVPHSLKKTEFLPHEEIFSLEVLQETARKAFGGLGKTIKSPKKVAKTVLKKLSLTGTNGAGRVLFLLTIGTDKAVFLMLRLKNDKQIGSNMSVQNPKFVKTLEKNLTLLEKDLLSKKFDEYVL
jgi:hypothetical protein